MVRLEWKKKFCMEKEILWVDIIEFVLGSRLFKLMGIKD